MCDEGDANWAIQSNKVLSPDTSVMLSSKTRDNEFIDMIAALIKNFNFSWDSVQTILPSQNLENSLKVGAVKVYVTLSSGREVSNPKRIIFQQHTSPFCVCRTTYSPVETRTDRIFVEKHSLNSTSVKAQKSNTHRP